MYGKRRLDELPGKPDNIPQHQSADREEVKHKLSMLALVTKTLPEHFYCAGLCWLRSIDWYAILACIIHECGSILRQIIMIVVSIAKCECLAFDLG